MRCCRSTLGFQTKLGIVFPGDKNKGVEKERVCIWAPGYGMLQEGQSSEGKTRVTPHASRVQHHSPQNLALG